MWKCRCIKKLNKFSLFKTSFFYRYLAFHFYFIYYLRFEKKRKIQTKYLRDYGERDETLDAPEVFDWISCVTWEETFFISRWIPTWYIFYLKFWIKSIVLTKGELQICTIETGLISYYTFKIRLFQNPFSEPFFRAHEFTKQLIMLTRIVFLESTESFLKKMLNHNKNSTVLQRQISLCIDVTFEVGKKY